MTTRTAGFTADDYARWRPRLLGLVSVLRRRGYRIEMPLALDIVHDFFVEAWPGLADRFDPHAGTMDGYVVGAFLRFARGRAIAETRWSRLFEGDLAMAETIANESSDQIVPHVATALTKLAAEERGLLLARFGEHRKTEQQLARQLGITRYEVRTRLLEALARLATELGLLGADAFDTEVARLLFVEGYSVGSTTGALGTTSARVRNARDRMLRSLEPGGRR